MRSSRWRFGRPHGSSQPSPEGRVRRRSGLQKSVPERSSSSFGQDVIGKLKKMTFVVASTYDTRVPRLPTAATLMSTAQMIIVIYLPAEAPGQDGVLDDHSKV